MQYLVEIDGKKTTRYTYNVWSVFEYEDGTVSKDARIFCSDNLQEFINFMNEIPKRE